jgi:hypothetical protein
MVETEGRLGNGQGGEGAYFGNDIGDWKRGTTWGWDRERDWQWQCDGGYDLESRTGKWPRNLVMPITDTDSTVPYPSRVSTSHVQDRTRQTPHVSLLVNEKPKPSYIKSVPQ